MFIIIQTILYIGSNVTMEMLLSYRWRTNVRSVGSSHVSPFSYSNWTTHWRSKCCAFPITFKYSHAYPNLQAHHCYTYWLAYSCTNQFGYSLRHQRETITRIYMFRTDAIVLGPSRSRLSLTVSYVCVSV